MENNVSDKDCTVQKANWVAPALTVITSDNTEGKSIFTPGEASTSVGS